MKKILGILPHSIGGRLTTSSIFDGFIQNGYEVIVFDELKNENFKDYLGDCYEYIIGYDFSPIKLKIDHELNIPVIAYFSDVIEEKTSGVGYLEYHKYLKDSDIFVFYWDRKLSKDGNWNYQPHFVNTEIYKNYLSPISDVSFMGRLDTDLRLNLYLDLNKKMPELKFRYFGIEKHYLDALSRCKTEFEKEILKKTYCGFIDNEKDMAKAINETKIVYNINAQGISSLNYRTIQVMACERLLISDKREELDLFDNILPIWENIDDLIEKIRFYLSCEQEYLNVTKKSREFIKLNHDSKVCVKKMIEIIEN